MAFSIVLAGLLGGCSGGGGDDGVGADAAPSASCMEATTHSDLAWIQTKVFTPSCTFSSCHKGAATEARGLNLESGMAHDGLVNKPSVVAPPKMLVVPGDPANSYLMVALGEVAGTLPEGGTMPLNSPLLCGEKRDAIWRWIEQGAQP